MKPGRRALGVAESYNAETSTLAGCVVRASRVVDGFVFGSCTVGGLDATEAIVSLVDRLDRDDVQYLFVAGIAPAWYNMLDLEQLHDTTALPVLAVTFEESEGLESAIDAAFDEAAAGKRLAIYRSLPDRQAVEVGEETVYVRAIGLEDDQAREVVRAYTPAGGRPEPLRVARQAARAADAFIGNHDAHPV